MFTRLSVWASSAASELADRRDRHLFAYAVGDVADRKVVRFGDVEVWPSTFDAIGYRCRKTFVREGEANRNLATRSRRVSQVAQFRALMRSRACGSAPTLGPGSAACSYNGAHKFQRDARHHLHIETAEW